jgi:hypothetical protein
MGDTTVINKGQVGAIGNNNIVKDNVFNQIWQKNESEFDLNLLSKELSKLRSSLREHAETPEHDMAIGEIASAEVLAKKSDGPGMLEHLKKAGKWSLQIAEKIGVPIAVEALKKSMGL